MTNTTRSAPVLSIDLAAVGETIWPCLECEAWHVEILLDPDGTPFAREWHAADCVLLTELLAGAV